MIRTLGRSGTKSANFQRRRHVLVVQERRECSYVQGQSPQPKVREYFYFIDHQGMLFLDDSRMKNFTSCFKDKKFLQFFFTRIRFNDTGRYTDDFPYLSVCGRERNFLRCDDLPIVYTHVLAESGDRLSYGHAGELLTTGFEPEKDLHGSEKRAGVSSGPEHVGGIGLVRSKLAVEFSKLFKFEHGDASPPSHFKWGDNTYELDQDWYKERFELLRNKTRHDTR